MAYAPLEIVEVALDDLLLDLHNYRTGEQPSQAAAMADLFTKDRKTWQTARSILINRYVDNEMPMVALENGCYVVLEGNERVCALKALHDPRLVPSTERELRNLITRYAVEAADLPDIIRVQICPNRQFAAPHIARLHTGKTKDPWDVDSQARFVMDQLENPNMNVAKLQELLPSIKVTKYVKIFEFRRLLETFAFSDPGIQAYVDAFLGRRESDLDGQKPKTKMSAFEYAYNRADIQEVIGIVFDKTEGRLTRVPSSKTEKRAFERLVWWFKERHLTTRSPEIGSLESPERVKAHNAFLVDLTGQPGTLDEAPNHTKPADSNSAEKQAEPTTPVLESDQPPWGGKPPKPTSRLTLDTSRVEAIVGLGPNFVHRIWELGHINVYRFPSAAALILRSLLESAAKNHYKEGGDPFPDSPLKPTLLSEVVARLKSDYQNTASLKWAVDTLNQRPNKQKAGSLAWFNRIAHSVDQAVRGDHVHEAWENLLPLVEFLLRRPYQKPTTP